MRATTAGCHAHTATVQAVKATEWAVLVSATASSIAAVASVSTWWRGRHTASWEVQRPEKGIGRWRVVNVGDRVARSVHIRVGRLSDPTHVASSAEAATMAKGEGLMVLVTPGIREGDYGIVVTWRGWFRRKTWRHPVV